MAPTYTTLFDFSVRDIAPQALFSGQTVLQLPTNVRKNMFTQMLNERLPPLKTLCLGPLLRLLVAAVEVAEEESHSGSFAAIPPAAEP
jgi:hypothetical protein